jgi:hypothetical protein
MWFQLVALVVVVIVAVVSAASWHEIGRIVALL